MDITEATLVGLGAEGARRIRAGAEAYPKILLLPRVAYDSKGNDLFRWRGTEIRKDFSLGPWGIEVDQ